MTAPTIWNSMTAQAPIQNISATSQGFAPAVQWFDMAAHAPWHSMASPAPWNCVSLQSQTVSNLANPANYQIMSNEPSRRHSESIQLTRIGSHGYSDAQRYQIGWGSGNENEEPDPLQDEDEFIEIPRATAFRDTILYHDFRPRNCHQDMLGFLSRLAKQLKYKILTLLNRFGGLKIWTSIEVEYIKPNDESDPLTRLLSTKAQIIFNDFQIDEVVLKIIEDTIERNSNFIQMRSG